MKPTITGKKKKGSAAGASSGKGHAPGAGEKRRRETKSAADDDDMDLGEVVDEEEAPIVEEHEGTSEEWRALPARARDAFLAQIAKIHTNMGHCSMRAVQSALRRRRAHPLGLHRVEDTRAARERLQPVAAAARAARRAAGRRVPRVALGAPPVPRAHHGRKLKRPT